MDIKPSIEEKLHALSVEGKENHYECPFCAGHRLHVNYEKGVACCHGCGYRAGKLTYLLKCLGLTIPSGLLKVDYKGTVLKTVEDLLASKTYKKTETIDLPEEYKPLRAGTHDSYERSMIHYLISRGVRKDIIEEEGIGYASKGRYAGCIIFPVYLFGKLVYFTTRVVFFKPIKSVNPKAEKTLVLFNLQRVMKRTHSMVFIFEGPMDVLACRPDSSVGLLGKTISKEQCELLDRARTNEFVVCLDDDAHGDTSEVADVLRRYVSKPVSTLLLEDGDPAELRNEFSSLIPNRRRYNVLSRVKSLIGTGK